MNLYSLLKGQVSQKELLNYYNATIIYEEVPNGVEGFTFYYDAIFFIVINKNLSYYKKKKVILHELAHIELSQLEQLDNKDFFEFKVEAYEEIADMYLKTLQKTLKNECEMSQ